MTNERFSVLPQQPPGGYSAQYALPQQQTQTQPPDGRDRVIEQWQSDAKYLAMLVPDFDFNAALQNDAFRRVLAEGGSVLAAYVTTAKAPAAPKRSGIIQNAQNPRRGTGTAAFNPAKLSSKDFNAYIQKLKGN